MNCTRFLALTSLASAVLLAGCIQAKTVVNVEKDGSGTVEQTLYHKMPAFPMGPAVKQPTPEEELQAARTQADKTAQKMGEGVTVKTVEQLPPHDGWQGMRIVYAFSDIGKIRVTPFPEMSAGGMKMGSAGPGAEDPLAEKEQETIQFQFQPQPSPKLTVVMPPMTPPKDAAPPAGDDNNPQAQAMAKAMMAQFLDGAKMELVLKVNGKITGTNASYVSADREAVGLLQMDLGSLVKDSAAMDQMTSMEKATTREQVEKQLQDPTIAKYFKAETKEQVDVTFE